MSTTGSVALDGLQEADLRLGHFYIDVHSAAALGGEIRGQILRPGETLWVAKLTGAQEVPANASAGTGAMSLIVNSAHTSAHYRAVTSLAPAGGHIHTGVAGVIGTLITALTFVGATSEADLPIAAADFSALDRALLYANVHTTAFPNGEIRGQLLRAGERLFAASLSGGNEVPPVNSAASGAMQLVLNAAAASLRYESAVTGLGDATSVFMVNGPAGTAGGTPVATLTLVGTNPTGTQAVTASDLTNLQASRYYVDIHSSLHPEGEIRGQIVPR
jgi:hypothetical protein